MKRKGGAIPLMVYFKPALFEKIKVRAEKMGGNKSTYIRGLVMKDLIKASREKGELE